MPLADHQVALPVHRIIGNDAERTRYRPDVKAPMPRANRLPAGSGVRRPYFAAWRRTCRHGMSWAWQAARPAPICRRAGCESDIVALVRMLSAYAAVT
jgi:hypothetical protein